MNLISPAGSLALLPDMGWRGTLVVGQLGQTLDGRIATRSGASKYINGGRALDHLHQLRASVDAVVVGVGTVIADNPSLTVRRVAGRHPARVVIDPAGRMPADWAALGDGLSAVYAVTAEGVAPRAPAEAIPLPLGPGGFAPLDIVAALAARGMRRILVEGGADTLARFVDAGAVDVLHVLVAPMILGSGKEGFRLAPVDRLDQALRPATEVHVFDDGDVLFTCDLRREGRAA